jgi:lysyl endopeptidase
MSSSLSRVRAPLALVLAAALVSQAPASAQLEYGGAPYAETGLLESAVPTETMPFVDAAALKAEDAQQGKGQRMRFGQMIDVELGLGNAGSWEELADGSRVWRLRIQSTDAHSLSFIFSRYQLPVGGELFVYNDDRSTVRGAYTLENHNLDGQFAIQPIEGDAVTFEYHEPAGASPRAEIVFSSVIHDYIDILGILNKAGGGDDKSRACETDVNCPEGDLWRDQINATTKVFIGGYVCSGSLVNNTARDGTQYYICADHCGSMNSAIFMFNYQRSGCETGTSPTNMTVQGSVQMATSSTYDYRLARITPTIPLSYGHILAGWDRTDTPPPNTTAIHHPQGYPKKISFDYDAPGKSGSQWHIYQWDLGVTEPGSSGSPLYSHEGRFIGQLCCGAAACGYPYDDYYGRLATQWNQISSFLDPLGTGETKIELYDPNGGSTGPNASFTAAPTSGNEDLLVAFTDTSTGNGLSSWSWNFGDSGTSSLRNPSHLYTDPGTYTVALTVVDLDGSDVETKVNYIEVFASVNATVSSRNGSGVNPNIFTSTSLPILGTDWSSEVDAGSIGVNGFVFVFVYSGSLPGTPTAFGELLLDPASSWLFTDLGIAFGGISQHAIAVPSDLVYLGNQAYAQSYLNSVAPSGQLTNGLDLVLGY